MKSPIVSENAHPDDFSESLSFPRFNLTNIDRLRQEIVEAKVAITENLKMQSVDCIPALSRSTRNQLDTLTWLLNAEQTLQYIDAGDTPAKLISRCLDFCSGGGVRTPDPLSVSYRCAIVKSVILFEFEEEEHED